MERIGVIFLIAVVILGSSFSSAQLEYNNPRIPTLQPSNTAVSGGSSSSGNISGTGTPTQVAYFNTNSTVTSDSQFSYDPNTDTVVTSSINTTTIRDTGSGITFNTNGMDSLTLFGGGFNDVLFTTDLLQFRDNSLNAVWDLNVGADQGFFNLNFFNFDKNISVGGNIYGKNVCYSNGTNCQSSSSGSYNSSYVPYTGANDSVVLGNYNLTANRLISSSLNVTNLIKLGDSMGSSFQYRRAGAGTVGESSGGRWVISTVNSTFDGFNVTLYCHPSNGCTWQSLNAKSGTTSNFFFASPIIVNTDTALVFHSSSWYNLIGSSTNNDSAFFTARTAAEGASGVFGLITQGHNAQTTRAAGVQANPTFIVWSNSLSAPNAINRGVAFLHNQTDAIIAAGGTSKIILGNASFDMNIGNKTTGQLVIDPATNIVSTKNVLQLTSTTLPTCNAVYNGSIGRNNSGFYACPDGVNWVKFV